MKYLTLYKLKKRIISKCLGINEWHQSLYLDRPYGMNVIHHVSRYFKNQNQVTIVEVGCGIGELIGNVETNSQMCNKVAYDINPRNIGAGKWLYPKVKFHLGSFHDVKEGEIDCLIMVGFIHVIEPETLKSELEVLFAQNDIRMIVLDTFKKNCGTEYKYSHDGQYLFEGKYELTKKSQGFKTGSGARRYVEYWGKIGVEWNADNFAKRYAE